MHGSPALMRYHTQLLTIAGEWASLGIVAGIPLQAATCLLLGLAAAGAASADPDRVRPR